MASAMSPGSIRWPNILRMPVSTSGRLWLASSVATAGRRAVKKTASPADYRLGEEAAHREFDFV
jgi:hypothetical protein